tara:strand:- start:2595 stop:2855 length:261 start_codon:yes stop_codon:yes gene_type:complete
VSIVFADKPVVFLTLNIDFSKSIVLFIVTPSPAANPKPAITVNRFTAVPANSAALFIFNPALSNPVENLLAAAEPFLSSFSTSPVN